MRALARPRWRKRSASTLMASNLNSRHTAMSVPVGALAWIVWASISTTISAVAPSAVTSTMAWRQRMIGCVGERNRLGDQVILVIDAGDLPLLRLRRRRHRHHA